MKHVLEIKLNKKIYPKKCVAEAAKAFDSIAAFKMEPAGQYTLLTITNFDPGIRDRLEGEFCNYVFHLIKRGMAR